MQKALEEDEIVFSSSKGKTTVSYKQYLRNTDGDERGRKPSSIISGIFTQHGSQESTALFGADKKFSFPKPESLFSFILESCTNKNDIILDSFLGSGTTAAVAHKMGRRYIGIEMGEHAETHAALRLRKVIDGEPGGISQAVGWQGGGGFRFYRLGAPVFDQQGQIRQDIGFGLLAAHIWFSETRLPLSGRSRSPLLGIHDGRAYALLYNGILGDKRPAGGNVLTRDTLALLRQTIASKQRKFVEAHPDYPLTIYGEQSRLSAATLQRERILFKQTPYDVKARA